MESVDLKDGSVIFSSWQRPKSLSQNYKDNRHDSWNSELRKFSESYKQGFPDFALFMQIVMPDIWKNARTLSGLQNQASLYVLQPDRIWTKLLPEETASYGFRPAKVLQMRECMNRTDTPKCEPLKFTQWRKIHPITAENPANWQTAENTGYWKGICS